MNLKYLAHILLSVPLIPLIYFQGKKVYKKIPKLPDAEGNSGKIDNQSDRTLNLLFIGESAIAGVGVRNHSNSFVGHFSKLIAEKLNCNVTWNVFARSGYNIQKINERILPKINIENADLILVGIGGNDSFELTTPTKFNENIFKSITFLQSKFPDKPIVFVNFPPVKYFPIFTKPMQFVLGSRAEILQDAFKKSIPKNKNIYFMYNGEIFQKWSTEKNIKIEELFSDGVHPSEKTYFLWAEESVNFTLDQNILRSV